MPGPACYGRGGTNATVTDAAVVAGMIDPDNYLNGRVQLDPEASKAVVAEFGRQFSRSTEDGANAILDLTVTNMAAALRTVSIERGHDPRRFTMFSYGGTLGLFAARICERLGIEEIVIPGTSSVFSAYGLLTADFVRRYSRSVELILTPETPGNVLDEIRDEQVAAAISEIEEGGLDPADCRFDWEVSLRFVGQAHELTLPLESLESIDPAGLEASFPSVYERAYGEGTAWEGSPVMLANLILNATIPRRDPGLGAPPSVNGNRAPGLKGEREVLQADGTSKPVPVYEGFSFGAGMRVEGQAIIDEHDTTLFVPDGWSIERDEFSNYIMKGAQA
jgi:N-methylhydantoinase A